MYVNNVVTGTTKVIHVPAFVSMLSFHIITDMRLLIVLVLNQIIIIWKNIKISWIFTKT